MDLLLFVKTQLEYSNIFLHVTGHFLVLFSKLVMCQSKFLNKQKTDVFKWVTIRTVNSTYEGNSNNIPVYKNSGLIFEVKLQWPKWIYMWSDITVISKSDFQIPDVWGVLLCGIAPRVSNASLITFSRIHHISALCCSEKRIF